MYAHPPILADKPLIKAFDQLTTEEINTIMLFALAYSNRMLFKSATNIKREMQLTHCINTMHVRYLLLLYFAGLSPAKQGAVGFKVLERSDYIRFEKKRLVSTMQLVHQGLAILVPTKQGNNAFLITEKGIKAISIVFRIIQETIHAFPRPSFNSKMRRVDNLTI